MPDVDSWRASLRDAIVEMDATPLDRPGSSDYTGWVYMLDLGPISVTDVASDPVHVARTPRLINHNPVDFYHLSVSRRPSLAEQHGRQSRLGAGDAILVDSSEPFSVTADSFAHYLIVNVPRAALRRDLRVDRNMLGQHVSAQNPSLRVLMSLLGELGRGAPELTSEMIHELGHTASELLVSTLRLAEAGHRHYADTRMSRGAQLLRMKDFAMRQLADPDLSPKLLAAAFDVSVRYVELVFRESGVSPSRFIREARLAEARRMLADPRQRHRSIAAIGRSVGIENASVFARIFRARYEATPREYRQFAGVMPD
ncbi:helix-turn-helix domain-containing protein [Streptodolium elevatio]|uniref:Helix-turn-helix domain-containing protein n=1 Tax=Streptodolium elevatio TaxID=3157996 RepID=A0ABV3DEU4_9ACTN